MAFKKRILTYPYHESSKASQKLKNFPLYLASKTNIKEIRNTFLFKYSPGFIQSYNTFVELLSEEKFELLENLVERNMIYRLKASWEKYKEQGYKMRLIGSEASTSSFFISRDVYSGSILPLRNLNYPSEYYDFSVTEYQNNFINSYSHISLKNLKYESLSFEEFESLDLCKINNEFMQWKYSKELLRLISLLNVFQIIAENFDFGIYSNYKIIIVDEKGNLVDGNNDDSLEFHSLRMEKIFLNIPFLLWFTKLARQAEEFRKTQLKDFHGQFTIIDIDGFMDKNLMVPK